MCISCCCRNNNNHKSVITPSFASQAELLNRHSCFNRNVIRFNLPTNQNQEFNSIVLWKNVTFLALSKQCFIIWRLLYTWAFCFCDNGKCTHTRIPLFRNIRASWFQEVRSMSFIDFNTYKLRLLHSYPMPLCTPASSVWILVILILLLLFTLFLA